MKTYEHTKILTKHVESSSRVTSHDEAVLCSDGDFKTEPKDQRCVQGTAPDKKATKRMCIASELRGQSKLLVFTLKAFRPHCCLFSLANIQLRKSNFITHF